MHRSLAVLAVFALVAAACGSSDDNIFGGTSTSSTVVSTAGTSSTTSSSSTSLSTSSTSTTTSSTTTSTTTTTSSTTTTTTTPPPPGLDPNLEPTFGSFDLESGFLPDPFGVDVTSGGGIDASYLGGTCFGWAAPAPDVSLMWDGAGDLLRFYFVPPFEGDTVLLINDPFGNWSCNDDSFGTLDPTVDFPGATAGRYDIWVASLNADESVNGVLLITEVEGNNPGSVGELNPNAEPAFGSFELTPGFTPDPFTVDIVSGGPTDVSYLGEGCIGFAAEAPDVSVVLTDFTDLFRFYFIADDGGDTALVINAPDGTWVCNDDSFETLHPTIDFVTGGFAGRYDVWVASFGFGENLPGTLYITELEGNHP